MNAFEAYELYLAVKQHFTKDGYDFHKFNGKVKTSVKAFENRKDRFYFDKLSKIKNLQEHLVANAILEPNIWVGDLLNESARQIHLDWMKRNQSLTYNFEREADLLFPDLNKSLKPVNGQYPEAYVKYRQGDISPETLIILNRFLKMIPYWDKRISDPISYPTNSFILKKYAPFVNFDQQKYKKILSRIANEYK